MRAAEEGIRRAADGKALGLRDRPELLALLQRKHQWLLGIDVLAGFEDRLRDRVVRVRDRQVDDDIDIRIGQQPLDALGFYAVFRCPRLGRCLVDVGAGDNLDALKQWGEPEVCGGDVAASDDADAKFLGHG
ncbi:hypothetical protein D9M72_580070 [compost metagenome]